MYFSKAGPVRAAMLLVVVGLLLAQPGPGARAEKETTAGGASDLITLPDGFDQAASDPRAIALAMSGIEALGGWERWQGVRALKFSFVVERKSRHLGTRVHYWDRVNGRHRVEMNEPDGGSVTVVRTLTDGEWTGLASRRGSALAGDDLAGAIDKAREAWVNDAHWLLMPFRVFEPGAKLDFVGRRTLKGRTYYVVKLTFNEAGKTPGGAYWAWYDAKTRRMDLWQYRLWSAPAEDPPSTFRWAEWTEVGGLTFSLLKTQLELPFGGEGLTVRFENVEIVDELPEQVFDPQRAAPTLIAR